MEVNMRVLLEEEFEDDPVYREIYINHLEEHLFTDKVLGMHPDTAYSTVETGQIIGRKDSTIRNYFRTELLDYINPEKFGKFYRLDYISVFKLHMISILVEKGGKATADIAFYCGITPAVSASSSFGNNSNTNVPAENLRMQEDISQIKQLMVLQSLRVNLSDEKTSLLQLQLQWSNNQADVRSLEKNLELMEISHQNRLLENKYYRVLDYSLKNTVSKKEEQKGLFRKLFKSTEEITSEEDIDQVLKNAKQVAEKEKQELATQEKNELIKQIEVKKQQGDSLHKKIEEKQRDVKELESKILYLNNNPDELKRAGFMNFLGTGRENE